jgi:hypothetical protein
MEPAIPQLEPSLSIVDRSAASWKDIGFDILTLLLVFTILWKNYESGDLIGMALLSFLFLLLLYVTNFFHHFVFFNWIFAANNLRFLFRR